MKYKIIQQLALEDIERARLMARKYNLVVLALHYMLGSESVYNAPSQWIF